jgi:hypothetical protein
MQQFCPYGSARGASGNRRPYRDKSLTEPRRRRKRLLHNEEPAGYKICGVGFGLALLKCDAAPQPVQAKQ